MTISFDRIADRYDETRAYTPAGMGRAVEKLVSALDRGGPLLEVGVGTGRFSASLQARGLDVTGVDVSRGMLEKARGKGLQRLLLGDATRLPFVDKAFRDVLSVHLTHLIADWRAALSEMSRVADGRLLSVALQRTGSQAERMQDLYEEVCAEHGFEVRHPGLRERELAELVPPVEMCDVSDEVHIMSRADAVGRYRMRTYSDQWSVPEEVHRLAVSRIEQEFSSGDAVERRERICVLVWDLDDIRGLLGRSCQ